MSMLFEHTADTVAPLDPSAITRILPLAFPWQTQDPFLFCAHHLDAYPKGDAHLAPAASLGGRHMGSDFSDKDGWSMYHGRQVPGFPQHPHRGFETITLLKSGFCDHSDSLGATARFGPGDAQWMTAGQGVVHAEMFPLRHQDRDNPLELFQIWLNLPRRHKMVAPYFTMLWGQGTPRHRYRDEAGKQTTVDTIVGSLDHRPVQAPPPHSWAAQPNAHVAVWTLTLEPAAVWTLPAAAPGLSRSLYVYAAEGLQIAGRAVAPKHRVDLRSEASVTLHAGITEARLLLLQGRPIGEPVVQYGPFVMNTRAEIQQAYADYHQTGFGGWPWPVADPVHARTQDRFAIHADGRREDPSAA